MLLVDVNVITYVNTDVGVLFIAVVLAFFIAVVVAVGLGLGDATTSICC